MNSGVRVRRVGEKQSLFYLYGFCSPASGLPREGIEKDAPVEWVGEGKIGALVSRVPSRTYEEGPLARKSADPNWLALRARRHNAVLLAALERAAVVPCRFGTLFRSLSSIEEILRERGEALRETLQRLDGRVEWSVKAYSCPGPRRSLPLRTSGSGPQDGTGYLLERLREKDERRERELAAQEFAGEIEATLTRQAEEVAALPLRNLGAGQGETIATNLACLARRSTGDRLRRVLALLAARGQERGLRLAWSGPWPPYSFAGDLGVTTEARG